jgi:hypothetical protein
VKKQRATKKGIWTQGRRDRLDQLGFTWTMAHSTRLDTGLDTPVTPPYYLVPEVLADSKQKGENALPGKVYTVEESLSRLGSELPLLWSNRPDGLINKARFLGVTFPWRSRRIKPVLQRRCCRPPYMEGNS